MTEVPSQSIRWEVLLKMSVAVGLREPKAQFIARHGAITDAESAEYDRLAQSFERLAREHPDRVWDLPFD